MDIKSIISKMSLEDKISLCTGGDFWHTKEMKQYGIPSLMMCDGPHGLRCQKGVADMMGINDSLPATCFPTAVTAGATWNRELYRKEGEAIGKEALSNEVSIVLGPGCNIKRNPLGGRSFEYISEDPYIAGHMAASFIKGVEGTGVGTSLKHFAVNSQEYKRMNGDSRLDERAFREIYLAPFEIAVKNGRPATVMCSYNKINGVHASDSKKLLTDILRDEWGFDGMVVTDWGALYNRIEAYKAGCDLNMPGGSKYMEKATLKAVKSGELDESLIDRAVERILRLVKRGREIQPYKVDFDAHHSLAKEIATEGAVLMKNEQIPGESFTVGERIKVFVMEVNRELRGPLVTLSRVHPSFVKRLFELEVPEIQDGTIVIKGVAREAGSRTKIAVYSRDENVEAVGSCIGKNSMRINAILDELSGEKVDIIKYSDDITEYVAEALSPAKVLDVYLEDERTCRVTVSPDQLSLAIGREGQNARLAAHLTGCKVDIKAE